MRRTAAIVDQDVGVGAGGKRGLAAFLGADVAGDRGHLGAGFLADLLGGGVERLLGARRDHEVDPGAAERHRAGAAEPLARGTDDRLLTLDLEIQHVPLPDLS